MKKILLTILISLCLVSTAESARVQLGWTAERQADWAAAKASYDANDSSIGDTAYTELLSDGNRDNPYNSYGSFDALLYLITGTQSWCDSAYNEMLGSDLSYSGTSETPRDAFVIAAHVYSWIYDCSDSSKKSTLDSIMENFTDAALGDNGRGTRASDSDEAMGHYFGLLSYAVAIRDDNLTRSNEILAESIVAFTGETADVGGVTSTGEDFASIRNTVDFIASNWADGGQWPESSVYNYGTAHYVCWGVRAINDYYGADQFTEIDFTEYADALVNAYVPGRTDTYQWGDVEGGNKHTLNLFRRFGMESCIADAADNANLTWIQDQQLLTKGTNLWKFNWALYFDPDATRTQPTTQSSHNANGMGIAHWRESDTATDSYFTSQMKAGKSRVKLDHHYDGWTNFTLWRASDWAVDYPRGYYGSDGNHIEGPYLNGLLVNGMLPTHEQETKGQIHYEASTNYLYHVGVTAGHMKRDNEYGPPPESLHEHTRSNLFIHHSNEADSIVIFDRVNTTDPSSFNEWNNPAAYSSIYNTYKSRATSNSVKHTFLLHTHGEPTKSGDSWSWTADNSETVRLYTYLDNYSSSFGVSPDYGGDEVDNANFYELKIQPDTKTGFVPMLHVIHVGATPTITEIVDATSGDTASGAYIETGSENSLVIFNATANTPPDPTPNGPGWYTDHDPDKISKVDGLHYFINGSEIQVTTDGNVNIFIADLDPDKTWTIEWSDDNGSTWTDTGWTESSEGLVSETFTEAANTFNFRWYNDGSVVPTCTTDWTLCVDQTACEAASWYWYDSICNQYAEAAICDSSHLDLCTTEATCETATGNWCANACTSDTCEDFLYSGDPTCELAFDFNEASGNLTDISSNAFTGTAANLTYGTTGVFGDAVSFNGSTSIITISDDNNLDAANGVPLSFCFWAKDGSTVSDYGQIIAKRTGNSNYGIYRDNDSRRFAFFYRTAGNVTQVWESSAEVFDSEQWKHFCFTYTLGTSSTARLTTATTSTAHSEISGSWRAGTGNVAASTNTFDVSIGSLLSVDEVFNGSLDELIFFNNKTLTDTQKDLLRVNGIADPGCSTSTLYLCDETECGNISKFWYDGVCNANAEAAACDATNWFPCTTQQDCVGNGHYWYDDGSGTEKCHENIDPGQPATVTIIASDDVYIQNGSEADVNKNSETDLIVKENNSATLTRSILLRFSLADIPVDSTIRSVELKLANLGSQILDKQMYVFELLRSDWVETEATWNSYKSGSSWTTAGARGNGTDMNGDFSGAGDHIASYSTITVADGSQVTYVSESSFVTLIKNNIGGEINLIIHQEVGDDDAERYSTSEDAIEALRPRIVVNYSTPSTPNDTPAGDQVRAQFRGTCTLNMNFN
jgi:hypothetical protein